jgi:hypothetical protein
MKLIISNTSSNDLKVLDSAGRVAGFVISKTERDFDLSGLVTVQRVSNSALISSFSVTTDLHLYIPNSGAVSFSGVPATTQILGHPLPSWAQASPNASLFYMGLFLAVTVRLTRAGLRWFKAVGRQDFS